jgi:hypothetical protein
MTDDASDAHKFRLQQAEALIADYAAELRLSHAVDEAIAAWREIYAQAASHLGSTAAFPRLTTAMSELEKANSQRP